MKVFKDYWWLLLTFISITLFFIIGYKGDLPELNWKTGNTSDLLGGVFAKLLIVGALLDQVIAVFFPLDSTAKEQRMQAQNALSLVKDQEKFIQREILNRELNSLNTPSATAAIQRLNLKLSGFDNTKQIAKNKIATIDAKRSFQVRMIAFAAGLILAMTGITILSDFIDMTIINFNHKILSYMDVIFTAAVLSGGTAGINALLKVIKDSWSNN